jgi:hypothetical protein
VIKWTGSKVVLGALVFLASGSDVSAQGTSRPEAAKAAGVNRAVTRALTPKNCFEFRNPAGRIKAIHRFGGSHATERAVEHALYWLARNQERNGKWLVSRHGGTRSDDLKVSLTGLSLLAFLGAGHTERVGKYRSNVRRAVSFLKLMQNRKGMIGDNSAHGTGGCYNHAIAGLALAEAYGMARIPSTGRAARRAVEFSCKSRSEKDFGGWRYNFSSRGADLSVTEWFVAQLVTAKAVGLKVPNQTLSDALGYVESCEAEGEPGMFGYQPHKPRDSLPMSSVGMHAKLLLGYSPSELSEGVELLRWTPPEWNEGNFYYWYYATQVMFQTGGTYWTEWNREMTQMLLTQQRQGNAEDGSWDPIHKYGKGTGRVWSTAAGALCLEVYYRYPRRNP